MALQKSVTTEHGILITDAYHKIKSIRTNKQVDATFRGLCVVDSFLDKTSSDAGMPAFKTDNYSFVHDLSNPDNLYIQAYTYLKTIPEYTGAADIIEP